VTSASTTHGGIRQGGKTSKMMKALAGLSGDLANRTNLLIVLACSLLAAGIFIIDIASLPLGAAAGVAYVAVVPISLWLPRWGLSIIVPAGSMRAIRSAGPTGDTH